MMPDTNDPALARCANEGCPTETWEDHTSQRCADCKVVHRLCDPDYGSGDICEEHVAENVFRPETDADRQAAWAGARGL